jgi:cell division protein FtsB
MERVLYKPNKENNKRKQNGLINTYFATFFAKVIFLVMAFFLFYNIFHSVKITSQKLEILNTAEAEVNSLRVKNLKLDLELEEMKKVSYLEVEARDRLNFTGKGETIFVIPDNLLERSSDNLENILSESNPVQSKSTFEVWIEWL